MPQLGVAEGKTYPLIWRQIGARVDRQMFDHRLRLSAARPQVPVSLKVWDHATWCKTKRTRWRGRDRRPKQEPTGRIARTNAFSFRAVPTRLTIAT